MDTIKEVTKMNNFAIGLLVGAAGMYVVAAALTMVDEEWVDNVFTTPFCAAGIMIIFPFVFLWKLVRNVVRPVSVERQKSKDIQEIIRSSTQVLPGIYFYHDKKATRLVNKNFFFRLKKNT